MAVENTTPAAGAPRVADDINELVSYAIVRGMLAPEDAIWAYNAILERIGEDGPAAPSSAVFLENGYQLSPTRDLAEDEPSIEIAFTDDEAAGFDLEDCIERIAAVGVANGREEDTPFRP